MFWCFLRLLAKWTSDRHSLRHRYHRKLLIFLLNTLKSILLFRRYKANLPVRDEKIQKKHPCTSTNSILIMSFGGWSPDVGVVFVSLEIMGFLSPRLLGSSLTLDPSRRLVSAVILIESLLGKRLVVWLSGDQARFNRSSIASIGLIKFSQSYLSAAARSSQPPV